MAHGEITLSEIQSQPQVWAQALDLFEQRVSEARQFWAEGAFEQVIFTGCGSTYYLGAIAGIQLQAAAGVPCRAYSASELILFPEVNFDRQRKTLLVCVSRSGTTRETVEAARLFRQYAAGSVCVVTCQSDSPLAQEADLLLPIDVAQERSRVQTRSFSSMAVTLTALTALWGNLDWTQIKPLPAALEQLMSASDALMRQLGEDLSITGFVFLGSGALQPLATEVMLKMTEMTRVPSVSYHVLEFLHGPRYATDAHTLIAALVSDAVRAEEVKALQGAQFRKAQVLALAENGDAELAQFNFNVDLASGIPEWGRLILYLPPLQMLGWHQAVKRGFDPDNLPFDPRDPVSS